jgi:serine/threonine protein kinase
MAISTKNWLEQIGLTEITEKIMIFGFETNDLFSVLPETILSEMMIQIKLSCEERKILCESIAKMKLDQKICHPKINDEESQQMQEIYKNIKNVAELKCYEFVSVLRTGYMWIKKISDKKNFILKISLYPYYNSEVKLPETKFTYVVNCVQYYFTIMNFVRKNLLEYDHPFEEKVLLKIIISFINIIEELHKKQIILCHIDLNDVLINDNNEVVIGSFEHARKMEKIELTSDFRVIGRLLFHLINCDINVSIKDKSETNIKDLILQLKTKNIYNEELYNILFLLFFPYTKVTISLDSIKKSLINLQKC